MTSTVIINGLLFTRRYEVTKQQHVFYFDPSNLNGDMTIFRRVYPDNQHASGDQPAIALPAPESAR